jgi:hypothetical protein
MHVTLAGLLLPGVENLSLHQLRAAVERAGLEARLVHFAGWTDIERTVQLALVDEPRVFGVSLQTAEAALPAVSLARVLRARGFRGRIVFGGHFATLNAQALLELPAGIDCVVQLAGEQALVALAQGAERDEALAALPGLVFRAANGEIRKGAPPAALAPLARVRERTLPNHLGFPAADLVLSRGCEAHCAYCCIPAASALAPHRYERPSAEAVAEHIAALHHERGARVFNVMDDNLLPMEPAAAATYLAQLSSSLKERKAAGIAISLQVRADAVTEQVADALRDAGIVRAYVGIDGYSPEQLRALGRKAPADAGAAAIERLWRRGIYCVANALFIGPTFRFETLEHETEALSGIQHAPVHLLPIEARPGTAYSALAEKRGLVEGNFLFRYTRCEDPRVGELARMLTSLPTRLAERSVPIALYDLGYNLGVAQRLVPALSLAAERRFYAETSSAWNRDQVRFLRAACEAIRRGEGTAFFEGERESIGRQDTALLNACDDLLLDVQRRASAALGRPSPAHARGRVLSAVAVSVSLAACTPQLQALDAGAYDAGFDSGAMDAGFDAGTCPPGRAPSTASDLYGRCGDCNGPYIRAVFDDAGVAVTFGSADGGTLDAQVQDCLNAFLATVCCPSLANQTYDFAPHCWIA